MTTFFIYCGCMRSHFSCGHTNSKVSFHSTFISFPSSPFSLPYISLICHSLISSRFSQFLVWFYRLVNRSNSKAACEPLHHIQIAVMPRLWAKFHLNLIDNNHQSCVICEIDDGELSYLYLRHSDLMILLLCSEHEKSCKIGFCQETERKCK